MKYTLVRVKSVLPRRYISEIEWQPVMRVKDVAEVALGGHPQVLEQVPAPRVVGAWVPQQVQDGLTGRLPALVFGCGARTAYFVQTRTEVLMINNGDQQVRHVYLGVPHSPQVRPSWYGESVGHYENGDTLVVDTIGLNDRTFIDNYRTPHSDRLHVTERWHLTDPKTIEVLIRVEDPGAFTMPWTARQIYKRSDEGPLVEMVCAENNTNYFGQSVVPIPAAGRPDF